MLPLLLEAAIRYRPVFCFHSTDAYLPLDVDTYLINSALAYYQHPSSKSQKPVLVAPEGELRTSNLASLAERYHASNPGTVSPCDRARSVRHWQLQPSSRVRHGAPVEHLDDVPVYARIKVFPEEERAELTYVTTYSYNGTYRVLGVFHVGHHDADLEHVTVELDLVTLQPRVRALPCLTAAGSSALDRLCPFLSLYVRSGCTLRRTRGARVSGRIGQLSSRTQMSQVRQR